MNYLPERNEESVERERVLAALPAGSHIHISGVCGTGTGAVAALCQQRGYRVTGSDKAFYPPMGDVVRGLLSTVYEGYRAENVRERPDIVVIGNNLSSDNPEVQEVMRLGIPYVSMPEVFGALLIGSREETSCSIVAIGTHGKTTTAAMVATMLDQSGWSPGYFIGGVPTTLPGSVRAPDDTAPLNKRVVVLEGDEYDSAYFAKWPKFHSYRPDILIITSLEFDHADIYESVEQIEMEFVRVARRVPKVGSIVLCLDDPRVAALAEKLAADKECVARVLGYGEHEKAQFRITERTPLPAEREEAQRFLLTFESETHEFLTTETGAHNVCNLAAAIAVGAILGITVEQIRDGIAAYRGVLRRQRVIAEKGGVTVIEDFAHHPTAVSVTLAGIRERYPERRIVAVFEPRSNTSRRSIFQERYASAFDAANIVLIKEVEHAGTFTNTSGKIVALDVQSIIEELSAAGMHASSGSIEEIRNRLEELLEPGDVVILMSNGDFGGLQTAVATFVSSKEW